MRTRRPTPEDTGCSAGVAAAMAGVTVRELRRLENRGLLAPLRRRDGSRRYRPEDIHRLWAIEELRAWGVPLTIARVLLDDD